MLGAVDSDWKDLDPSEVDRYQVPRPTATDQTTDPVSSQSSPTNTAVSNTSAIPSAEGTTEDVCTAKEVWEDELERAAEGGKVEGRGVAEKEEDEEESNALLLSSSQF